MLIIDEHVDPALERQLQRLSQQHPELSNATHQLQLWFRGLYGGRILNTTDEYAAFLTHIRRPQFPANTPEAIQNIFRGRFTREVSRQAHRFPSVNQAILQVAQNSPGDIADAETLHRHRNRTPAERHQELNQIALEYLRMMSAVSPEALATALETLGPLSTQDHQEFVGILTRWLHPNGGQPTGGPPGPGTYLNYDPELLQLEGIREYVLRILRRIAYTALIGEGIDSIHHRPSLLPCLEDHVCDILRRFAIGAGISNSRVAEHGPLFHEISSFYKYLGHLATVEIPNLGRFVNQINDHQNNPQPFPSLRQLVATGLLVPPEGEETEDVLKQYTLFNPGGGKTAVPFLVQELYNSQRRRRHQSQAALIYTLPASTLDDIVNQVQPGTAGITVRQFYSQTPDYGVIRSIDNPQERANAYQYALERRIIFCPISMMGSNYQGQPIINHLCNINNRLVFADEGQLTVNSGGSHYDRVRTLFLGAQKRMIASGTPTAEGGFDGFATALEALEDPNPTIRSGDRARENHQKNEVRITQPLARFRARLHRLVALDPPENYSAHWTFEALPIPPEMIPIFQAIANQQGNFWQKYHEYTLLSRVPALRDPDAISPLLTRTQEIIEANIALHRVILVIEDEHAAGIFYRHPEYPEDSPYFNQCLQPFVENLVVDNRHVEFEQIYGGVDIDDRPEVRARMEGSANGTLPARVVAANARCVETGLDLRSVGLIIQLGPPYRIEKLEQRFCRAFRIGHAAHMIVLYMQNSLEDAKLQIAQTRHHRTHQVLAGDQLPQEQLDELEQNEQQTVNQHLSQYLTSYEQRVGQIQTDIHGAGTVGVRRYWEERQAEWRLVNIDNVDRCGLPGNLDRFVSSLVAYLAQCDDKPLLEVGTSGLSLFRHLHRLAPELLLRQNNVSIEPHQYMLDDGSNALMAQGCGTMPCRVVGTALSIPQLLESHQLTPNSIGCMVLRDPQNYRWNIPEPGQELEFGEMAQAILYARRIADVLILPFSYTDGTDTELQRVRSCLQRFDWQIMEQFSGVFESQDNHGDRPFRGNVLVATHGNRAAPSRSSILPRLARNSFQFTHASNWSTARKAALQAEQNQHQFPYIPIATQFAINGNDHLFDYDHHLVHADQQLLHLQELRTTVTALRQAAPTAQQWWTLPLEMRNNILTQNQIRQVRGNENPGFYLNAYPEYTFHPYEPRWDALMQ